MQILKWSLALAFFILFVTTNIQAETIRFTDLPKSLVHILSYPFGITTDRIVVLKYAPSQKKIYSCIGGAKEPMGRYYCGHVDPKQIKGPLVSLQLMDAWRKLGLGELHTQAFTMIALTEMNPPFQQIVRHLVFVHEATGVVHVCKRVKTEYEFKTIIRNHTVYFYSKREPIVRNSCERVYPRK